MLCPYLLDLSEFVFQINLTTLLITSLARFLAKCYVEDVPEGEFGTDVKEKKPIVFDVGSNKNKQISDQSQASLKVAGPSDSNPSSRITEECELNQKVKL